jgi:hypothetical protein
LLRDHRRLAGSRRDRLRGRSRGRARDGRQGALAIVAATGAPWIGFDADGAIVELGAVEPHHDDVAERSPALSPT